MTTDLLSPVGQLHHEVEHGKHHQEMKERVAVRHTSLLIVDAPQSKLPLLFVVILCFIIRFLIW